MRLARQLAAVLLLPGVVAGVVPALIVGGSEGARLRWGALGKVRQLDQRYPRLQGESSSPTATFGAPAEHLDVGTVLKAAQEIHFYGPLALLKDPPRTMFSPIRYL